MDLPRLSQVTSGRGIRIRTRPPDPNHRRPGGKQTQLSVPVVVKEVDVIPRRLLATEVDPELV